MGYRRLELKKVYNLFEFNFKPKCSRIQHDFSIKESIQFVSHKTLLMNNYRKYTIYFSLISNKNVHVYTSYTYFLFAIKIPFFSFFEQ